MAMVKTAISISAALFKEADATARRLRVPRSRVFAMALEDFLERRRNRQLLDRINKAWSTPLDSSERRLLDEMESYYFERIKDEW
jgi:metal-responsive CopG/Arc/MetJ family transcriptional regulator